MDSSILSQSSKALALIPENPEKCKKRRTRTLLVTKTSILIILAPSVIVILLFASFLEKVEAGTVALTEVSSSPFSTSTKFTEQNHIVLNGIGLPVHRYRDRSDLVHDLNSNSHSKSKSKTREGLQKNMKEGLEESGSSSTWTKSIGSIGYDGHDKKTRSHDHSHTTKQEQQKMNDQPYFFPAEKYIKRPPHHRPSTEKPRRKTTTTTTFLPTQKLSSPSPSASTADITITKITRATTTTEDPIENGNENIYPTPIILPHPQPQPFPHKENKGPSFSYCNALCSANMGGQACDCDILPIG